MSTRLTYTGDGYQTSFAISFPYLSTSHVRVYVNEILQLNPMHYTIAGGQIVFKSAPGVDAAVVIQRSTSPTNALVDFQNGSVLSENELDTAYLHNFYLSQEYADSFNKLINDSFLAIATGNGIVETEPDLVIAALVNEMLNQDAAAALQQAVNDIATNAEAILTLGEGLQTQINTLAAGIAASVYIQPNEPVPGVGGIPDPIPEGARWYDSDDNNHPYIYQSGVWVNIEDPRIGQAVADITLLQVDVGDNEAAILAEQVARANADSAFASTLALIGAQNGGGTAFIINLNTVQITDGVESLADRFNALAVSDSNNAAAVISEQTARINADGVIAGDLAVVSSTVDGHTSTISQHTTSINGIQAEYGVTLNVDGHVSGFKTINQGTGSSAFVIAADKFAIANASNPSLIPFEIIGSKIRMRGDVEISGSLLLNGSVVGAAIASGTIGTTHIGANAITSTQINANAITADKINANAVTSDKIFVTTLQTVQANTGDLNVTGALTMNASGHIKGGQTAFNTGNGFFLGYESAAYKFSIGNSAVGNYLAWDGSTLTIKGNLFVGVYVASDTVLLSAPTERSKSFDGYVEEKAFQVDRGGTVRIKFEVKRSGTGDNLHAYRVYRGATLITEVGINSTTYYAVQHDVSGVTADEIVSVQIQGSTGVPGERTSYIRNCTLCAAVTIPAAGGTVTND